MSKKRPLEGGEQGQEKKQQKEIRVWTDGCFDLMHWGHANALRQAKELGTYLIVGVHSDKEIMRHKGPPLMKEHERYAAVRACKWVDEVVEDAPYNTELKVLNQHNVDFCVHGDDLSTDENGRDTYWEVKEAGKYKEVKRTEGVSTTDLVGRMLLVSKAHFSPGLKGLENKQTELMASGSGVSFLASTRKLQAFLPRKTPTAEDKIVYLDGTFDLFHAGHISTFQKAKQHGTYLIVGIHDDQTVNRIKGLNHPIMNLYERVLSVLACRYVDEVVIGAPWAISKESLGELKVSVVVAGKVSDAPKDAEDPYRAAKQLKIFKELESGSDVTTSDIIQRVINNRLQYEARNQKKLAKEARNQETERKLRESGKGVPELALDASSSAEAAETSRAASPAPEKSSSSTESSS